MTMTARPEIQRKPGQWVRLVMASLCVSEHAAASEGFRWQPENERLSRSSLAFSAGSEVKAAQAVVLSAVVAAPQMAHAGTAGYAVLQLGWAVFIISLGPAVLFWIYFNKPELL